MSRASAPLAVRLLDWCVAGNDPLIGDLIEDSRMHSRAWLWRQVLFAAAAHASRTIMSHPRATLESSLGGLAMLALLGFHALVVATLINHLLVLGDSEWTTVTGRFHHWQGWSALPGFTLAVGIGRAIEAVHRRHRVAALLAFGASASAAAFLNLLLFVPDALFQPFVPHAALQTAIGMVFIGGLFVGTASRRSCAPHPSS